LLFTAKVTSVFVAQKRKELQPATALINSSEGSGNVRGLAISRAESLLINDIAKWIN